jgi:hypothetical protein
MLATRFPLNQMKVRMAIEDNAKVLHLERSQAEPGPQGDYGASSVGLGAARPKTLPQTVRPEKLMRLLSDRNLRLLRMFKTSEPKTLAELSRLSGPAQGQPDPTLARLSSLGIVVLKKAKGRGKFPTLACDTLQLDVPLVQRPSMVNTETGFAPSQNRQESRMLSLAFSRLLKKVARGPQEPTGRRSVFYGDW